MPSPFAGMDPYLEGAEWTSVHVELTSAIARQLAPLLAPRYIVRPVRRFITTAPNDLAIVARDIYPDVGVYDPVAPTTPSSTTVGVVAPSTPLLLMTVIPEQEPQYTIEIRDQNQRMLVTAIEVLSPTNKRAPGYYAYLDKRTRLLHSPVHLLEIDLLRQGTRVPMVDPLPPAPYFIFLSRVERRPISEVWPIQLNQPLPVVPVPLQAGDADVMLDVQAAFTAMYDGLRFDLAIDYTRPPDVPLPTTPDL